MSEVGNQRGSKDRPVSHRTEHAGGVCSPVGSKDAVGFRDVDFIRNAVRVSYFFLR